MDENHTPTDAPRPDLTAEEWKSLADMLAFTLDTKLGHGHRDCDPAVCAVAFVLSRYDEAC